jgi:hypothetical protein
MSPDYERAARLADERGDAYAAAGNAADAATEYAYATYLRVLAFGPKGK